MELKKGDNEFIAKKDLKISNSGLDADNCEIIFSSDGKSWNPEHTLNRLTKFVKNNRYIIRAKKDVEISKL